MDGNRIDFFISHAGVDRSWAEWIAWQLEAAGYSVELDVWDWAAGQNVITKMSDALKRANLVLALLSAAYLEHGRYTTQEWTASLVHITGTDEGRLVPVLVEKVPNEKVPPLLRPLISCDLSGLGRERARHVLLEAVRGPARPDSEPVFPAGESHDHRQGLEPNGPQLPGSYPPVWNVPTRNPGFTGREKLLVAVREALQSGNGAVVQALHGLGGIGKTQMAIEYAHRFASSHDLVWWINADEAALVSVQVAALARELGCAGPGAKLDEAISAIKSELRQRGRWLLVFDNASEPGDVADFLPGGMGHVLITSRAHDWAELAVPVEVGVLSRGESVSILTSRIRGLSRPGAGRVAEALGNLPLALAQAAGYMSSTGTTAAKYLDLLATRTAEILDRGQSTSHAESLTAVTQLAYGQLNADDPAAELAVAICAYLAPEPIPVQWFPQAADLLPAPLASEVAVPVAWGQVMARIQQQALGRLDQHGLLMHRLTQAIVRSSLAPSQAAAARSAAEAILAACHPGEVDTPDNWPGWALLLPHLLALDPAATRYRPLRDLACDAARYLIVRGNPRTGYRLAERLHLRWRDQNGPDDQSVLSAGIQLAFGLREMSRYDEALELEEDTVVRCRNVLGDDHSCTLAAVSELAAILHRLGRFEQSLHLNEDTFARRRRLLGDDNPQTLESARNLAVNYKELSKLQAARELEEDTLARSRQVFGDYHPRTLESANNLAVTLSGLGDVQAARELDEEVLNSFRRILGRNHPHTISQAINLAEDFRDLGDVKAALELDQSTLPMIRRVLGVDHAFTLIAANNLADDLRQMGDARAARDLDEDTLARRRRVLGSDHQDTLISATNLASDLRALGDARAARDLDEDTLARRRRVLGDDHPGTQESSRNLAVDMRALGET